MGYLYFSSNLTLKKYADFICKPARNCLILGYVVENIEQKQWLLLKATQ